MGSDNLKQCLNMDSEEIITQTDDSDLPSNDFNTIIGYIEDIVISDSFQEIQTNFLDLHCMEFTNEEENKIIYMQIFNDYTKLIENFILDNLQRIAPHIDMIAFLTELRNSSTQFDGEIYEFLFSLTDFQTFKALILDYKEYKTNETNFNALDECFTVTKL